jgi:hypothetical protein
MPGSWPPNEFPYLTDATCEVTSPATGRYNCIAWAAKDDRRWWWPDPLGIGYWPLSANRRDISLSGFVAAFESLGYQLCLSESLEVGLEKIAIYGIQDAGGTVLPTHAALQLPSGEWTSKLGNFEDITHPIVDSVCGPVYGRTLAFMVRPRSA